MKLVVLAFIALIVVINGWLVLKVLASWLLTETAQQPDEAADWIDYGGRDQWYDNLTLTESGRVDLERSEQEAARARRERGQP